MHHMCKHITAISRELTAAEKRAAGATMSAMLYPLRVGCISLFQARAMAAAASRALSQLALRDALSLTVSACRARGQDSSRAG